MKQATLNANMIHKGNIMNGLCKLKLTKKITLWKFKTKAILWITYKNNFSPFMDFQLTMVSHGTMISPDPYGPEVRIFGGGGESSLIEKR